MNLFTKTIFPREIFDGIEKKDGNIALLFFAFLLVSDFILLYLIKISPLFLLLKTDTRYYLLCSMIIDAPGFLGIILILKFRKQSMDTVGLRKIGLKSSIVVGGLLFLAALVHFFKNDMINQQFIYRILFYMIFVGFYEELIFRGFIWTRLAVDLGKWKGTIISGLFFGIMHIPLDIVFKNRTFLETGILGNVSNTNIIGGIIVALVLIYIYTRNKNILLPSFIHGILDMI
ncbi:CPBP family intramembrane glutamic endopeptidase [Clostridium tyrobutyricum]|uniref:CPBP family intramembrane glutamic endopeptidase n=1 Tax=Clostridium tyrobutyricum TaxID=1519 RepID=UPI0011CB31F5|nr:CPBP family intramembrane glutamic endopeptidase [Clostridium tyrobutyricum]